ncbi:MAG: SpoIIE family protein phosphatase [Terracidiphilus sp.]|nr:SpoIIE family protein phosphatase [Terracidiphilus sp.]
MSFPSRVVAQFFAVCLLALVCVRLPAQSAPPAASISATLTIDGPWRFQLGDDSRWADPSFDDAAWRAIFLSRATSSQGIEPYTGFAWYRIHLTEAQLAPSGVRAQALLLSPNFVGQLAVFINGVPSGSTPGMANHFFMVLAEPFLVPIPPSGPVVVAIRTWAGAEIKIQEGLLGGVEAGPSSLLATRIASSVDRRWNQFVAADVLLATLFLILAGFGLVLFLAQRSHAEYLWFTLLGFSVAAAGLSDAFYGLGSITLATSQLLGNITGRIFMAVTFEFVFLFTQSPLRRTVRIAQAAVLLLVPAYLVLSTSWFHQLSIIGEMFFVAFVSLMLLRAWTAGRKDAGILLVPFFFVSIADSLNGILGYLADHSILPSSYAYFRFQIGPVVFRSGDMAYAVFLAALASVILYRFIRVSQLEQRSSAEISAARSVQSLLIPTQLPSNKHFMLESAYLPVHGVGGDFFQVLPLPDDSLLLVVGDVSGKGLQAAMNSSTLVGALRNELSYDPATILAHLNRVLLGAVASPGQVPELDAAPCFATCLCARVYPDGRIEIANAGHLSPYRDGRELPLPPGLPLGVIAGVTYEQVAFQLNRGDRLVFLSDGVVEAANAQGELFGFERTQQVSHESARYIASTAQHFGQTDDITVVSLYLASRAAAPDPAEVLETA